MQARPEETELTEAAPEKKRGVRDVLMLLVAAALMISPSYLGNLALHRLKLGISEVALIALVLFLVGVFLLVKVVSD